MPLTEQYMLPCLNKKLLGIDCLGCGLQRSVHLLYQGEFIAALQMYPAIYPLILLFAFIGINVFFKFKYSNSIINILAITSITIIVLSYIIKLTN